MPPLVAKILHREPGGTEQVCQVMAAQVYDKIQHDIATGLIQPFYQAGITIFPKNPGDTDQFFCHDDA